MRKGITLTIMVLLMASTVWAAAPRTQVTWISPGMKTTPTLAADRVVLKWRVKSWDPVDAMDIVFAGGPDDEYHIYSVDPEKKGAFRLPDLAPGGTYFWSLRAWTTEGRYTWGPWPFKTK